MKDRELYSIEGAQLLLGVARKTIYDLLNDGELASVVIGRRRFIPAAAITAFIGSAATRTAPSERRAVGRRGPVQMPLELDAPPPKPGRRRRATRVMLGADQKARI
jgi:excisionase family DNA binding protein